MWFPLKVLRGACEGAKGSKLKSRRSVYHYAQNVFVIDAYAQRPPHCLSNVALILHYMSNDDIVKTSNFHKTFFSRFTRA